MSKENLIDDRNNLEVKDKVTALKSFVKDYQMKLLGKTRNVGDGTWKQTGKAIAGKKFIELSSALIDPYSNESNLISSKDRDMFLIQYDNTFKTFNSLLARSTVDPKYYDCIAESFRTACLNIGDIIGHSKDEIFKVLKNNESSGGEEF